MLVELEPIPVEQYDSQRDRLFVLVEKIWPSSTSLENVKHSIERWGLSKKESGEYFYIKQNGVIIGLTGYFIPNLYLGTLAC